MRVFPMVIPSVLAALFSLMGCKTSAPATGAIKGTEGSAQAGDPAGQRFNQWLSAFNAADRGGLVRVYEGDKDPEQRASMDLQFAQRSGGFDIHHIQEATPTERIALMRGKKTGNFRCFKFLVGADAPHHIDMVRVDPPEPPPEAEGPAPFPPLDDRARREVLDALGRELNRSYVLPDQAAAMESELRARQGRQAYDKLDGRLALSLAVTEDLRRVSHDRHLTLDVSCSSSPKPAPSSSVGSPGAPVAAPPGSRPGGPAQRESAIGETRRLDGNIAYIEIPTFEPEGEAVREEIRKAMTAAADAAAIIFDVRNNGGGGPDARIGVTNYLFGDAPVPLSSYYVRATNRTEERFTDPHVAGTKFGPQKPVYILTGRHTFSAAEAFAYDLQALKRAVIVGETTGGGAQGGDIVPLPHGFAAFIPNFRSINPITKTNWQGVGVKPDVEVSADKALETAQKLAKERIAASNPKK